MPLTVDRLTAYSLIAGAIAAAMLLATSPGLPMVWDEGYSIRRAEGIARWSGREWAYTTQIEGHPAFSGILVAAGQVAGTGWLEPLQAARLGPILLYAVACGTVFYRLGRDYSLAAAASGSAAMLLVPRLFAHAHFASYDGPLAAAWVLSWAAFVAARKSWPGILLLGAALGLCLATKITGWLAPVGLAVWTAAYRDRAGARALAVAVPLALVAFFVLNPPLWPAPVDGFLTFFRLNLTRAANPDLNISTQFLGRMYDLESTLPWYNTLFWTAATVPVGILLLAVVGGAGAVRRFRTEPLGVLVVLQAAVLLVVRALPGVPPHDGVRLFLPAMAMLAVLAGLGTHLLWLSGRRAKRGLAVAALGVPLVNLPLYAPQWLSYYSPLVGALPGATALGMEPTYYWDSLDRSVLGWLHAHTPEGEKIHFGAPSWPNLELMRRWGVLRRDYRDEARGAFAWHVIQRRPSAMNDADEWLIDHSHPAFTKSVLGVPLLQVYPYQEYLAAQRAVAAKDRSENDFSIPVMLSTPVMLSAAKHLRRSGDILRGFRMTARQARKSISLRS